MTKTEKTIVELITESSRDELEARALAAFNLNTHMLEILRILTSDISSGTDRRDARESARKLLDQVREVNAITTMKESV